MNIKYLAAALAATTFVTPAFANDVSGARAEAVLGWDNTDFGGESRGGFLYGLGLGYDFSISDKASLGIDAEYSD
ncbi:MAG: outer membrane protein, partial [Sphingomonadaceae bacterium]